MHLKVAAQICHNFITILSERLSLPLIGCLRTISCETPVLACRREHHGLDVRVNRVHGERAGRPLGHAMPLQEFNTLIRIDLAVSFFQTTLRIAKRKD